MSLVQSNSSIAGVMFGLAAFLMFPVHDALAKWLVQDLSVWQIMFVRSTTILLLVTPVNGVAPFPRAYRSPVRMLPGIRALVIVVASHHSSSPVSAGLSFFNTSSGARVPTCSSYWALCSSARAGW